MTEIVWDSIGEHFFEIGVDRGVLYSGISDLGVAWNGLISVEDTSDGEDPVGFYIDGFKYFNMPSATEFKATIEAFMYPDEFEACQGMVEVRDGFLISDQLPQPFGLSYRTRIGNDLVGVDYGYKIHLVYNALVAPSSKNYSTISDSPEAITFSWEITTTPVEFIGFKPSAHFVIDSTRVPPEYLEAVENILYGVEGTPRLPTPDELFALFLSFTLHIVDHGNGTWTATGADEIVIIIDADEFTLDADTVHMENQGLSLDSYEVSSY